MLYILDSKKLPSAIYRLFFHNEQVIYKGQNLQPKWINLRAGGRIKKIQIGDYTYLQQNPHTKSEYAKMARRGSKIYWIIHTPTDKYIGRVIDGNVCKLVDKW